MNMWMTISMFAVVATAATVVGSTPLEERQPRDCCHSIFYECAAEECSFTDDLLCAEMCWDAATDVCGGDPDSGFCPSFFGCFKDCVFTESGPHFRCYELCKTVPCWLDK
uniref:Ctr_39_N conopeptide n=1 Tax=Conus tribblei TaxID=101761 RepID=A0A0C9SFM7_CONTD